MGTRGIKICKGCNRSFAPQISDADMLDLFYTEEQVEQDREHEQETGHSHLGAPFQDLCLKCASDPELEQFGHHFFGGQPRYRKRRKMKKLKVEGNMPEEILPLELQKSLDAMGAFLEKPTEHNLKASDGTDVVMTGSGEPPPQEIIDMMAALGESLKKGGPKSVHVEIKKLNLNNQPQKKRPWWAFWKKP